MATKAPILTINDLSPELRHAAMIARCEVDFPFWLSHYAVVEVREKGIVPMHETIWKFQESLASLFQSEKRLIILKARQVGVSTLTMSYAYWRIRFGKPGGEHVVVLSKSKEDASQVLLAKIPIINAHQPEGIRMDAITDQSFRFVLSNGNSITCLASTEAGGRGRAATCVILDEHAFHQAAEKNWAGIYPTLEGLGSCIIISTGNGIGNLFHSMWEKAKMQESAFTPVFIGWYAPAHRNDAWLERERADYALTEEQFKQEYPDDDREAFIKSGTCPFDVDWILNHIKKVDGMPAATQMTNDGRTRIFIGPEAGKRYAAGLDCAQGVSQKGNADRTSLKIIDMNNRHVASWDGRMELTEASMEIYNLLQQYNPYLCVERNGAGAGMIAALQGFGYANFYRFQPWHAIPEDRRIEEPTIGITQTQTIKGRIVGNLVASVNAHALDSRDVPMWREFINFAQKGPMKWEAQSGNDDQVIAMGLAQWARAYLPPLPRRRKNKKVRWC